MRSQLEFLSVQLHRLNSFKTMFQSTEPMLHYVRSEVRDLLKTILADFIKMDVVKDCDPFTLDVDCSDVQVPLEHVYIGINASQKLSECKDPSAAMKVKEACLKFSVELVKQIRSRFKATETEPIFRIIEFLKPSNAVKCNPPSLWEVYSTLP